jgi:hypothetical protein
MPLEENIITWNVTNWLTVALMGALFFAAAGLAQSWWSSRQSS